MPLFPSQPGRPEEITRHTPLSATLELFEQHLRAEGKSVHTVTAFMGDLHLLVEFSRHDMPVGQYTTSGLNEFLHWMEYGRGVPCSRKTYARRVTTLKVYFKWLHHVGAIPHDPAQAVLQRSGPAPLSHVLTPEEVRAAIDFAQGMKKGEETDYRPEFLFRLLLETGIKKGEAARLKAEDVDRSNPRRPVLLIRHKARNVYKERRIEIDTELVKLLDLYLQQYHPRDAIFNCTARNLEYILTDVGEGAEIPFKLSFEVMRWTCAVRDARAGLEEELIREKLGLSRASWYETHSKIKQLLEQQLREEA